MLLVVLVCVLFVGAGISIVSKASSGSLSLFHLVFTWICILFFGLGSLLLLYWLLKERLTGQPYLTISDEGIVYDSVWKQFDIRFADVESFELLGGRQNKYIGIRYKKGVERKKLAGASGVGRLFRKLNLAVSGTQESFSVRILSMNPECLYDMLDERLRLSQKTT